MEQNGVVMVQIGSVFYKKADVLKLAEETLYFGPADPESEAFVENMTKVTKGDGPCGTHYHPSVTRQIAGTFSGLGS